MAAQHRKRNRQSKSSKARRRRAVGLSTTAGAALAFGLTPWATAPPAPGDELDVLLDPIINSLSAIDPTLAVDATSLLSTLDTALSSTDPASALPAASTDFAQLYDQFIYAPSQAFQQEWIDGTSFLGSGTVAYDNFINGLSQDFGGPLLIGNGLAGTEADPTGGAGGVIFGDGGTGWNSDVAGDPGGAGGIAYDGNGGEGGTGFDGTDGGAGGDTAYGVGGEGGAGGAGTGTGTGEGGEGGAGG